MDILNQLIAALLGFSIEFIKLFPLMIFLFKFKLQSAAKIITFSSCAAALLILSAFLGIVQNIPVYTYICVLLTILLIRGENRILYTFVAYLGICIFDMMVATVWIFASKGLYEQVAHNPIHSIIINAISVVVVALICIISKIFFPRQGYSVPQKISRMYFLLILLGELSLLAFITAFQLNDSDIAKKNGIMAVGLSIGSIVFLLVAAALLVNYISRNHYKNISEINEKLIRKQEQYYSLLLKKEEETRKFRHDIKNHLNCMHLLFAKGQYDELERYFDKLGASLSELHSSVQTGNDMISAILNDVSAKYDDISLNIDGKLPDVLRLNNTDICTIFYNLFDNAFAAAEQSKEKNVDISIKLLGSNLFFSIQNTVLHKVEVIDNTLKTEKSDTRQHGYGSGNAVICAERNGGSLLYRCSDTHFVAELILPSVSI